MLDTSDLRLLCILFLFCSHKLNNCNNLGVMPLFLTKIIGDFKIYPEFRKSGFINPLPRGGGGGGGGLLTPNFVRYVSR